MKNNRISWADIVTVIGLTVGLGIPIYFTAGLVIYSFIIGDFDNLIIKTVMFAIGVVLARILVKELMETSFGNMFRRSDVWYRTHGIKMIGELEGVYINWSMTLNNKPGEIMRFKIKSPTSEKTADIDSGNIFDSMENTGDGLSLSKQGPGGTQLQFESTITGDLSDDIRALRMAKQFVASKTPATVPIYLHPKKPTKYFIDYSKLEKKS